METSDNMIRQLDRMKLNGNTTSGNSANGSTSGLVDSTKHAPNSAAEAQIEGGRPSVATKDRADEPDHEDIGPAIYPPILENIEVLGYLKDKNGIDYPRDIGCSVIIHDEAYFIFGTTVCQDSAGNPAGTTSNTIAYVENRANCIETEYGEISDDGKVKAFVPLNEEEIRFEKDHADARIVFRMSGGAVDISVVGVVWFRIWIEYLNGEETYLGVGQARLSTYADGKIVVHRLKPLLFEHNEPKMGSFSTLYYKGHVYLWGDRDGQTILARVNKLHTAVRNAYEYWSGSDWVPHWQDAQPLLHNMAHGAIIHTHLFGKEKPFLFIGVNNRGDSMVQIGAAAEVQGPFQPTAICKATGIDHDEKYKHFIYPHLFASNVPKRELMISWSEQLPGGVIAAKLKFKIDEVAAVEEAKERQRAAEEQEARRLAMLAEEEEAKYRNVFESEEDNDPRPKRDRSEGRLRKGYILSVVRTTTDPPPTP